MTLVDAHVHLHDCFSPEHFLDAAADNMAAAAQAMGLSKLTPGMLLFTQSAGDDAFGGLTRGPVGRWSLAATQEPMSMSAHRAEAPPLLLVAGRQIVTAEGLEVLALGTAEPFADGMPVEATIEAVQQYNGVPVMPWGFGKWWRRRGAIVRRIVADRSRFPLLFLGDNAGRVAIAGRPRLFAEAERQRRAILPGTDPLPLPAEIGKVGRLLFRMEHEINVEKPFADLRLWLQHCAVSPPTFGTYERIGAFLRRQIAMQLRKRRHSA